MIQWLLLIVVFHYCFGLLFLYKIDPSLSIKNYFTFFHTRAFKKKSYMVHILLIVESFNVSCNCSFFGLWSLCIVVQLAILPQLHYFINKFDSHDKMGHTPQPSPGTFSSLLLSVIIPNNKFIVFSWKKIFFFVGHQKDSVYFHYMDNLFSKRIAILILNSIVVKLKRVWCHEYEQSIYKS